jgi:hypothetical protein
MTMPSVKIKKKKKIKTFFLGYVLHLLKKKENLSQNISFSAKIKIKKNEKSNFIMNFKNQIPY